jgi:DNA-binding MarR family transcriptional regulator
VLGMPSALVRRMDAVFFRVKAGHLASQRFGRRLLRASGLTPARFDLMHAIGRRGAKQSDLWKRLNVVRSVISEMLRALGKLGWIARVRAPDSRTWLVRLTRRGRETFERAYDEWVDSGIVKVRVDAALCEGHVELDAEAKRVEVILASRTLDAAFRAIPRFRGPDLYFWDPADYYGWLTDAEERFSDLPFADAS